VVKVENGDAISGHVTTGIQLRFAYNLTLIKMHSAWISFYEASIDKQSRLRTLNKISNIHT